MRSPSPATTRLSGARSPGWSAACAPRRPGPSSGRARPELGSPGSTELLVSLDGVTSGRRARIAAASRDVPTFYVITLVATGLALIANSGALVFRSSLRTSVLIVGVASVVGLSLALLFSLSAPWSGPLIVSGHPLDTIIVDLRSGFFDTGP